MTLPIYDVVGIWFSIFLTICIFSFLFQDNPAYKLAEHIFLGVSIGVGVVEQWFGVFKPNLIEPLKAGTTAIWSPVVALVLLAMLFTKLSRKYNYLARTPIALMVAAFAAVKMTGEASGNLMVQVSTSMPNLAQVYAENGLWSWQADGAGVISSILLVAGLVSCLVYFYFSVPHDGPLRYVSRFGVWVLMVSFGASFGYTVMGRISLAYGRVLVLLGMDKPPAIAEQIHAPVASAVSIVLVIAIIAALNAKAPPEEESLG